VRLRENGGFAVCLGRLRENGGFAVCLGVFAKMPGLLHAGTLNTINLRFKLSSINARGHADGPQALAPRALHSHRPSFLKPTQSGCTAASRARC
jgi:hypothetical protein